MIYVQHLLGIGHLRRTACLANALAKQNFNIALVSGGRCLTDLILNDVTLYQLPWVRSLDATFKQLVDERGLAIDETWKNKRKKQLLKLFEGLAPDALITETYPFGRRMMRFELIPLLDAAIKAEKKPIIISSIRDILQAKSQAKRNAEIDRLLHRYYAKVLVHGDPAVAKLEATYPLADRCKEKTVYTGYITHFSGLNSASKAGANEVIISGGGGAASLNLLKTAIAAKPLSALRSKTWRLLVGNNIDHSSFKQLQTSAGNGLIIQRNRSDFATLLKNCSVSVSQAGYNTVVDILHHASRAVLVPFAENGEVEQTIRANLLSNMKRVKVITEENMTPVSLAKAIALAANMPIQASHFNLHGAEKSAQLIAGWLGV